MAHASKAIAHDDSNNRREYMGAIDCESVDTSLIVHSPFDPFRCLIHHDILFEMSSENMAIRSSAEKKQKSLKATKTAEEAQENPFISQEDIARIGTGDGNSNEEIQGDDILLNKFQVESSTLECLISNARTSAYFASIRLNHRQNIYPHQLATRLLMSVGGDESSRLVELSRRKNSRLEFNFGYERCLKTCQAATEAVVQILEDLDALARYADDPDILWSLWLHQSVSFFWESESVVEVLDKWSKFSEEQRQQGLQKTYDNPNDTHYDDTALSSFSDVNQTTKREKELQERARNSYLNRQENKDNCTCAQVTLGKRSFRQRLKDLFSPSVCDTCKNRSLKPPAWWTKSPIGFTQ